MLPYDSLIKKIYYLFNHLIQHTIHRNKRKGYNKIVVPDFTVFGLNIIISIFLDIHIRESHGGTSDRIITNDLFIKFFTPSPSNHHKNIVKHRSVEQFCCKHRSVEFTKKIWGRRYFRERYWICYSVRYNVQILHSRW